MTKYKYILFDADGTLFDYHKAERKSLGKTFEYYKITDTDSYYSQLYKKINHECWDMFEKKMLTLDQLRLKRFTDFINKGKLGDIDPLEMGQKYLGFLALSWYMLDGAMELLEKVYETHTLVMITNGIKEIQYSRIREADIGRFFKDVIISDEIGYQKPSAEYFDITMDRIGNPDKKDVIVVGDSLTSDIAGGNRYGLDTCWINLDNFPSGPDNEKLAESELSGDLKPDFEVNSLKQVIEIVS